MTRENHRAIFGLGTSPDGFALTSRRFLPIAVMNPQWIDWGRKHDLSFARTGSLSWKARRAAGTMVSTIIQISAKVCVNADRQVRTNPREVAPGGMLPRNPLRRPEFQKSYSPMVGGGLGHEISSHSVCLSLLRTPICAGGDLRRLHKRRVSSPGSTAQLESLCSAAIVRSQ